MMKVIELYLCKIILGQKPCSPTQGGIAVFDGTLDDTVLLTMANQGGGRIETYNSKGFLTAVITSNDQAHGGLALNRGIF